MDEIMPKSRDEKTGKYTEQYTPEEFLSAIGSMGGSADTQSVANKVGCAYRTAHAKLTELEDDGKLTSQKVGNAKLWILDTSDEG